MGIEGLKWQKIDVFEDEDKDDEDDVWEVLLSDVVNMEKVKVRFCCGIEHLRFRKLGTSSYRSYCVRCRNCGRRSEETDRSWERAIVLWDMQIEQIDPSTITLDKIKGVLNILSVALSLLRWGVENHEERLIGRFMKAKD